MKKINKLPVIISKQKKKKDIGDFPLDHYSYSTFVRFSTNPILFKINYINGDQIESTRNVSGVIGNAFHAAMETYYSHTKETRAKQALQDGMNFLGEYNDGFIEFSTSVKNKQKAQEIYSFAFNEYLKAKENENVEIISCEEMIEEDVSVKWRGRSISLPVKLKGYIDKIVKDKKGRLKIVDYKTTRAFSDPDKIDGSKILQAIQYYFLVYAKYGEAPYSMIFEELKTTKNRDGSPQLKKYEIVYEKNDLFFDFYFRFYDDVTRAINGEAVFVPNIYTFFDNEVSIISYIHRLDEKDEMAKAMKKAQVNNITELLKKKIHNAGNMRKFMKTAEKKFISAKNLNYNNMKNNEKITTKLMEYGMMLQYEGKIIGSAITMYKFTPSIGLKMSKLLSYTKDVEQVLGVSGIRVLAPIPNTTMVGFEVPNENRTFIDSVPSPREFELAIGRDIYGKDYFFDFRDAPHILVAGASGSGKSVFLNSIISQLTQISNVELHLFDPKRVELIQFKQKAKSYQSNAENIALELMTLVDEMEKRYVYMEKNGLRKMKGKMPYKIIIIDEFGDLTIGSNFSKEILQNITLLAQKARACGMHIIIATQRPSVDVITGTIKNNFPTKVAFKMAKAIDSQVVLGENGAEKLLGKGDMIFSSDTENIRLQCYNK